MQHQHLAPVTPQERIQTIDIIRGIALLGIMVINFTTDDRDAGLYDGFEGLADQMAYWTIRVFLDDRFQSIYCFLFGLGFTIQLQRAADRNLFFGFTFLRRMIALYVISMTIVILTGHGFNVLPYYAMVGVLLLLFLKVPVSILPWLSVFFFLLPVARNAIVRINQEPKINPLTKSSVFVEHEILDKYVGVYEIEQGHRQIIKRNGDSLIGEGPARQYYLTPLSDTHFIRKDLNWILTFTNDSATTTNAFVANLPNGISIKAKRIQTNFQQALEEQLKLRNNNSNPTGKPLNYSQFVKKNATNYWTYWRTWKWQNFYPKFLWEYNYKIGYILVLFLLGMYAGKRKVFHDVEANREFLQKVFKWGLIIGGAGVLCGTAFQAGNFFYDINWNSYSLWTRILIPLPWEIGVIFIAMAYIASITLLVQNPAWQKQLSFFSIVGRLGLTNYILHLFAFMLIFDKVSWFWGMEGKIGCLYRFLLAIPVYGVLYLFSRWWLNHFKQGPFEWLWRSLTYLKLQPMKNQSTDKV